MLISLPEANLEVVGDRPPDPIIQLLWLPT